MKFIPFALGIAVAVSVTPVLAAGQSADKPVKEVAELMAKVKSFQADIEILEKQGSHEQHSSSTLKVSKELGWQMTRHVGGKDYESYNDFKTSYEYSPSDKEVIKLVADRPDVFAAFRKAADDINPLALLDPRSIKFLGEEEISDEPVYHFEGTTTTQFMPQGQPLTPKMEAWISKKDGLPRKTIETVAPPKSMGEKLPPSVGTTIYSNVIVNPEFSAKDFKFTPPDGVKVIDANEQMARSQQRLGQMRSGRDLKPEAAEKPAKQSR